MKFLKLTHWSAGKILVNPTHITQVFAADPGFGNEEVPAGTMIVFPGAGQAIRVLEDFGQVQTSINFLFGTEPDE